MIMAHDLTVVAATGSYWYAPTGTARPTNATTPGSPWTSIGDTDSATPFTIAFSGGNATTLGTWQNVAKRVTHDAVTIALNFTILSWDIASLMFYWGSNATTVSGRLRVAASPTETTVALYVVIQDGLEEVAMYFPSVSIFRNGDLSGSATAFTGLPVTATILGVTGTSWLFEIDPKTDLDTASLANSPSSVTISSGTPTSQLTVTATLTDSTTRDVTALATYTTSDATKATVSAAGLITRVATGSATITSSYGEKTATTAVTVS